MFHVERSRTEPRPERSRAGAGESARLVEAKAWTFHVERSRPEPRRSGAGGGRLRSGGKVFLRRVADVGRGMGCFTWKRARRLVRVRSGRACRPGSLAVGSVPAGRAASSARRRGRRGAPAAGRAGSQLLGGRVAREIARRSWPGRSAASFSPRLAASSTRPASPSSRIAVRRNAPFLAIGSQSTTDSCGPNAGREGSQAGRRRCRRRPGAPAGRAGGPARRRPGSDRSTTTSTVRAAVRLMRALQRSSESAYASSDTAQRFVAGDLPGRCQRGEPVRPRRVSVPLSRTSRGHVLSRGCRRWC